MRRTNTHWVRALAVAAAIVTAGCGAQPGPIVPGAETASAIQFTPGRLSDATVGVGYFYDFCGPGAARPTQRLSLQQCAPGHDGTPSGGHPPYHFQLDSGTGFPPMGLHLQKDGVLNGTPTTEGTITFRVCAIDLDANQACGSVTLKVRPGARRFAGTWNTQPLSAVCPGGGGTWTGTFTITGGRLTGVWRDSYSNTDFRVDAPITPDGTATWMVGGGSESITLTGRFGAADGTVRGTLVGPVCTSVAGRWRGTFQGAAR